MCRWDRFAVTRYPLQSKGASFTAEELVFAQGANQCRPTGITVDAAGRVFVTSLYLGGNVVSPHCPSDLVMLTSVNGCVAKPFDETTASAADLWTALDSKSWDIRRRVHAELLRRNAGLQAAIERLNAVRDDAPAAAHLPWLAAASGPKATAKLRELAADKSKPILRIQALRALAAFPALKTSAKVFADALADAAPAVQLAGLEGLFVVDAPLPIDAVAKQAAGADPVLRQTAATLLARRAALHDFDRLMKSDDASMRLAAILAVGIRLTVPTPDALPPVGVSLHFPKGSAFFSPALKFADAPAPIDLSTLGPIGSYTSAERWSAGTRTPNEDHLFKLLLAALDDREERVQSQAAYYLGWLRDARSEPGVKRVRLAVRTRGLTKRPPVGVKAMWRIGRFADANAGQALERGPINLTAAVSVGDTKLAWEKGTSASGKVPLPAGKGVVYAYFRIHSRDRQTAQLTAASNDVRIWHNGRAVSPEFDGSILLDLQPGSNDLLVRTTGVGPLEMTVRARGGVSAALPEKIDGAMLAERLKHAKGPAAVPADFGKFDWSTEGKKGDAERGRKLFGALACSKCHAVTSDQAGGGAPSLADAGTRFTPAHLAESILLPDRLVADEFRSSSVVTVTGKSFVGLVVRESNKEIELLMPDATRQVIKIADIEERKLAKSSPMPSGLVKTPDELRDLLAYLLSERPLPP